MIIHFTYIIQRMQPKILPFLLLLSTTALAQPTITSSNNPVNGDTYTYHRCDSVGPGASGANVTWNFANLNSISSYTGTFQSCPGAPSCGTYPGSTIGMEQGAPAAAYYIADANRFAWNGERVNTSTVFVYSNPKDVRRYPFTMGDSYTDDHKSVFTTSGQFTRTGVVTAEADAYGTLITPAGTFPDCLRIHLVDSTHDSSHVMSMMNQDYIRETYAWYKQGHHEFLLVMDVLYTLPGPFALDTIILGTVAYIESTVSVNEVSVNDGIKIYPVPAHDYINIELTSDADRIELIDILGKRVDNIACTSGRNKYTISTNNIPTGVYFIKIYTKEGLLTRKIEVQ